MALETSSELIMFRYLLTYIVVQTLVPFGAGLPAPEPQVGGGGMHT